MNDANNKTDITAVILTKNEELNIENCIRSVLPIAQRIVLIDSGSTDNTCAIAEGLGAQVIEHEFVNYALQFNWALKNADIDTKWVYRIDADEVVPSDLADEILSECRKHANDDVNAFLMKHKMYFLGKYLKHGGAYPFLKITIFKPEFADFEEREFGEHVVLKSGRYITLKNDCLHHDCKDITSFVDKHNSYATREVKDYFERAQSKRSSELYAKAQTTQKLRDGFYYKLPPFFRARFFYIYKYYFKLGFLDGKPGKIYALLQTYVYRTIVDAKIYEAKIEGKNHEE